MLYQVTAIAKKTKRYLLPLRGSEELKQEVLQLLHSGSTDRWNRTNRIECIWKSNNCVTEEKAEKGLWGWVGECVQQVSLLTAADAQQALALPRLWWTLWLPGDVWLSLWRRHGWSCCSLTMWLKQWPFFSINMSLDNWNTIKRVKWRSFQGNKVN